MTKKDYIAIADAIRRHKYEEEDNYSGYMYESVNLDELIQELCDIFQKDNPLFDRDRFTSYINSK